MTANSAPESALNTLQPPCSAPCSPRPVNTGSRAEVSSYRQPDLRSSCFDADAPMKPPRTTKCRGRTGTSDDRDIRPYRKNPTSSLLGWMLNPHEDSLYSSSPVR